MASFALTKGADRDLLDIYLFGFERFGPLQAARYLEDLEDCFQLLAENPRMGRTADVVSPGLRRHEHASHVVFYRVVEGGIEVGGVIHKSSLREVRI